MLVVALLAGGVLLQSAAGPDPRSATALPALPQGQSSASTGQSPGAPAASDIFAVTNRVRATQGLQPLAWNDALAGAAHAHALRMSAAGALSHQYPGEPDLAARAAGFGVHFSTIAENIAEGVSARQIEDAWMRSMPHRMNILDPRMNALGISMVMARGMLYAVEDLAAATPELAPSAVEQRVAAELRGLAPLSAPLAIDAKHAEEARRVCARESEPGSAAYMVTWQGADTKVPRALADAVGTGKYQSAAVGACAAADGAFTVYRITVMLE